MWISENWTDYELLDCSDGEKLERWGKYVLVRPEPQAIWKSEKEHTGWYEYDARYHRSSSGGGSWEDNTLPSEWQISYNDQSFNARFNINLMNFKHTGLFPEQAVNWEYISDKIISAERKINVLNLFAYTGGATLAAASAGASVCHVDASRGMVSRARFNAQLSGLEDKPIRWITDDCSAFIKREIRRGRTYDAIIMDPPSYGRGPSGEIWKLEDSLHEFVRLCADVLSDNPLFILINSYTTGLSPSTLSYLTRLVFDWHADSQEVGLPVTTSGLILPCGATCRVEF